MKEQSDVQICTKRSCWVPELSEHVMKELSCVQALLIGDVPVGRRLYDVYAFFIYVELPSL